MQYYNMYTYNTFKLYTIETRPVFIKDNMEKWLLFGRSKTIHENQGAKTFAKIKNRQIKKCPFSF